MFSITSHKFSLLRFEKGEKGIMNPKNTTNEIFGVRLKALRKQNGYTIEQFAKEIGVAKSTVGYYENENRMPDIEI